MSTPNDRGINPWFVVLAVAPAAFMEVLDSTVVNVSIPHMAGSLGVTNEEATWAITTYLVANAVVLPMTGWLANFFGRRKLFLFCLFTFTLASVLCGISPNLTALLFFRVLQGVSGGILIPISQSIMMESFPSRQRGRAMAAFGVVVIIAPIVGPILGGWLTDNFSWRWVFYINIPAGAIAYFLTTMFVFDPPYIKRTTRRIDYIGMSLLALGLASMEIVLDNGQLNDWFGSSFIVNFTWIAGISLVVMVFWELHTKDPIVDLRLFKDRNFAAGIALIAAVGVMLYGSIILQPIYLQTLMGYTALLSGLTLAPRGMASLVFSPLSGILTERKDPRYLVVIGISLSAFPLLFMMTGWNLQTDYGTFIIPNIIQGAGLVFLFVPLTTATMAYIPNEKIGMAAGLYNLVRNVGGSAGIALVNTMMARRMQFHHARLVENFYPGHPTAQQAFQNAQQFMASRGLPAYSDPQSVYGMLYGEVTRQSAMLAFIDNFWLLGLMFFMVLPLLLLMRKPPHHHAIITE
jgi:DHA2 family multidrug resistance protein